MLSRVAPLMVALISSLAASARASTPVQDLAKPPADAQRFIVLSTAGKHGESSRWMTADGVRMGRESFMLRGQVFEVDSAARLGADGMLESVSVRGFTPNGDAAEHFSIADGKARLEEPGRCRLARAYRRGRVRGLRRAHRPDRRSARALLGRAGQVARPAARRCMRMPSSWPRATVGEGERRADRDRLCDDRPQ